MKRIEKSKPWEETVQVMRASDIADFGLCDGQVIGLKTEAPDDVVREKRGLKVFAYNIPKGCAGAYFPECNALIPLSHHAEGSKVPAGKSIPVRIFI